MVPFLRARRGNLVLAAAATVVAGAGSAAMPIVQRELFDIAVGARAGSLGWRLAVMIAIGAVIYLGSRAASVREIKAANDTQYLLYDAVHRRMMQIDGGGRTLSPGQLAARLNSDIMTLARAVASLPRPAGLILSTALSIGLMLKLNPVLTAVTLAALPILWVLTRRSRRVIRPATWAAQQQEAEVAQVVNEGVSGIRVVKAFGQEQREIDRMAAASAVLYGARMRIARLEARLRPSLEVVPSMVYLAVVGLGGWLVLRQQMSLGTFLAFTAYQSQLIGSVRWLSDTVLGLQEAGVCANRVLDLLDLPPAVVERPGSKPLADVHGAVEFDRVRFGYSPTEPVLKGLSLRIAPGETVALVGASGSGKSTAVEMLGRFHDATSGAVRLDGVDLRDVTVATLRHQVGVVFEEPFLFSGTLRGNIAYGRPDADDRMLAAATYASCADEFIHALPDGYDTAVGERGLTLSGGQRQRVALARTLLTQPRILVLDNATGAVDAELEREIFRRLRGTRRTVVFVAYRGSTLALADRIVVLDDGRLVDEGGHDELMARCALYRRLVDPAAGTGGDVDTGEASGGAARTAWRPGTPVRAHLLAGDVRMRAAVAALPPARDTVRVDSVDVAAGTGGHGQFSLWRLLRPHRALLVVGLLLVLAQTGAGAVNPYLLRHGVDHGILGGSPPALLSAVLGMFAVVVLGLAAGATANVVTGRVGQRVIFAVRNRMWAHLVRLPIAFFERQKAGRLLTRMVNDVEAFSSLVSENLVNMLVAVLTMAGVLVAMLAVSPPLTAPVVAVVLPFLATLWAFNAKMTRAYGRAREHVADANAALQENLAGIREAQAFGQQARQHAEYQRVIRRYLDSRLAAERLVVGLFPVTSFLHGLALSLALGVGAYLLAAGRLTAGGLIAFLSWVNLFYGPLPQLSMFYSDWKRVRVSMTRMTELMRERPATAPGVRPVPAPRLYGELRLCDVRFRYPNATVDALRGIDLCIPAGKTIAFVGDTGAGKSTIVKLLAGFYEPTVGRILVDGVDLRSLDSSTYRAQLGYVPQETFLFPGTVRDNIAYGRPAATDEQVEAAARAIGAHEAICALPGGYRHAVGERGGALSAGQRQLVCLARAYLIDPSIVLLDEATANLDLVTEAGVLRAMRTVARGRTTVVIAHRLQTAMEADRIAVVVGGRIVEVGRHLELLAAGGRYADLYAASVGRPVVASEAVA